MFPLIFVVICEVQIVIVFTGRFQPFHNGHISLIDYIKKLYPNEILCIAIVRNVPTNSLTEFDLRANHALNDSRNLLTSEKTLYIVQQTLSDLGYKNVISTLIPRPSDQTWHIIDSILDSNRIWAFTCNAEEPDEWEQTKIDYYKSKGEKVIVFPINKEISGTKIRNLIKEKNFEMLSNLLPKCVFKCIVDIIQ